MICRNYNLISCQYSQFNIWVPLTTFIDNVDVCK